MKMCNLKLCRAVCDRAVLSICRLMVWIEPTWNCHKPPLVEVNRKFSSDLCCYQSSSTICKQREPFCPFTTRIPLCHCIPPMPSLILLCSTYSECTRGGFCNFMHLKPISRELRRELYGRRRKG